MTERQEGSRGKLLRVLGLGFGLAVVVGGVVGQGILRGPGIVAAAVPHETLILVFLARWRGSRHPYRFPAGRARRFGAARWWSVRFRSAGRSGPSPVPSTDWLIWLARHGDHCLPRGCLCRVHAPARSTRHSPAGRARCRADRSGDHNQLDWYAYLRSCPRNWQRSQGPRFVPGRGAHVRGARSPRNQSPRDHPQCSRSPRWQSRCA